MSFTSTTSAQESASLFKIITVKDEIVVGLTASEITELKGNDASTIGRALAADGELFVASAYSATTRCVSSPMQRR